MRRIIYMLVIFLTSLNITAQPWLKYYSPGKSTNPKEEYDALVKAFDTYWKDKEPGHGSGYKPFMRWAWMVGERIQADGRIGADILWQEYLAKQEYSQGKSIPGNWYFLGPQSPPTDLGTGQIVGAGRIDCIAFDPTDTSTFYIGSPTGGLWKTTDDGATWIPLTDNLPSLGIADIAIHPRHPDTIYVATGDRDAGDIYAAGILASYDGGTTWQNTGFNFQQSDKYVVNRLLINPNHPDTLLAGTNNGLYFITNGVTFASNVLGKHIKDMEFKPDDPEIVYAASYQYGGASVYKSTDGGKTFTESSSGMNTTSIRRIDLTVTPARPDMVMAICSDKESSGLQAIYRSFNAAVSWTSLLSGNTKNLLATEPDGTGTGGQGWYDLTITMSPDSYTEFFTGGINIWKSINGGGSWQLASFGYPEWGVSSAPYVHVDQHILKFHPATGALYSGNDGGIYRSYDKGETWTDISSNLGVLQIYRIGISPQKRSLTLMGSQDNSSIMATDTNWYVVIGGDGMECIVDYTDTNTLYVSSQYGKIQRSTDGGFTFHSIKPNGAGKGGWITPYIINPDNHKSLLAGYEEIYETFNQGKSWTAITSNLGQGNNFRQIAISSFNTDVIYATTGSNSWRSDDHGKTWVNIQNGLGTGTVRYFAIHQYDPHTVWAALSNYSIGDKVYYSEDGGNTWTNYSLGLPNIPVNCLVYQNNSKGTLYAGTDLGVYYRTKSMDRWKDFGNGLPNVIVNELEIFYPDSVIRAATYGRGLWESPLIYPPDTSAYADFSVDKLSHCLGSPFRFFYHGSEVRDSMRWIFGANATPESVLNSDTVLVDFNLSGKHDITLIVYKNGNTDTLTRIGYVKSVLSLDISIATDFDTYFWRGDTAQLVSSGAETYTWSPATGLDTTSGSVVFASPDSSITYYISAAEGNCQDEDSIRIDVYPNDFIRYALSLQTGTNGPFINNGASVEVNEPMPPAGDCNTQSTWCDEFNTGKDYLGNSVWFTFSGPAGGIVSIDSRGFDEQIAVYEADNADSLLSGAYTLLAANDDYHDASMSFAAAITEISGLTEGKTYWVQVDGSGGNSEGTFYLDLYDSPLGVNDAETENTGREIDIYPNPNNGSFTLHFNSPVGNRGIIRIYSSTGQILLEKAVSNIIPGENIHLQPANLSPGLYILTVTSSRQLWKARMIIQ
ncbi:MAG: T9SS type A sorting domain-containing protein [Chlorobi bacterium]|nr:T9SS type A sorting domain-containing protein [Chlorobiota bacterium]